MKVKTVVTKTLTVKPNNNSADAISPNYVYGCFGGCMKSYCYVGRYNSDKIFITKNVTGIHQSIIDWAKDLPWPKIPNQQDDTYYMVDIGCNTDIPLHRKQINLNRILAFYDEHPKINLTFATKYPTLLTTDVTWMSKRPRVRVSLMPQFYSNVLEPKTDSIKERVESIKRLQALGWEVHINFSPVIVNTFWLDRYSELFKYINQTIKPDSSIKCEVIFLTNHANTMNRVSEGVANLLRYSNEYKNETVMRYPIAHKGNYIRRFKELLALELPWCKIRYIF